MARTGSENVVLYEYHRAADPMKWLAPIPVSVLPAALHQTGASRVIPFDLSKELGISHTASSPNLLAAFVRVCAGETLPTSARSTSQAFYVIRGSGSTTASWDAASVPHAKWTVEWREGDLFTVPVDAECSHTAAADSDAALYWVNDEPLLRYLGVRPAEHKFEPAHYTREQMRSAVEHIRHEPGAEHRNRLGVLLGNVASEETKTLTHTLWSLLNVLPARDAQPPHRHNSVALDLAVYAAPGGKVYTLMAAELDEHGAFKDPVRVDWESGAAFTTPTGWWHSHVNESDEDAWVLPMQDAGLYSHQRTLDIRFTSRKPYIPGLEATYASAPTKAAAAGTQTEEVSLASDAHAASSDASLL